MTLGIMRHEGRDLAFEVAGAIGSALTQRSPCSARSRKEMGDRRSSITLISVAWDNGRRAE